MKSKAILGLVIGFFIGALSCVQGDAYTTESELNPLSESEFYNNASDEVIISNGAIQFQTGTIYPTQGALTIQVEGDGSLALNNNVLAGIIIGTGEDREEIHVYNNTNFLGKIRVSDDNKSPQIGDIRFNAALDVHEGYNSTGWHPLY